MTVAMEVMYTMEKVSALLLLDAFCDHGRDKHVRLFLLFHYHLFTISMQ